MVDYEGRGGGRLTSKTSCKFGEDGWVEHLLILFGFEVLLRHMCIERNVSVKPLFIMCFIHNVGGKISPFPARPLGFTTFGEIFAQVTTFNLEVVYWLLACFISQQHAVVYLKDENIQRSSCISSSLIVHAGYVCCRHSPVYDMNVRIFSVCAIGYMCAQIRPWFKLSSERVCREWSQNHVNSKGKNPLNQTAPGGSNTQCCTTQDSNPSTLPAELFSLLPDKTN